MKLKNIFIAVSVVLFTLTVVSCSGFFGGNLDYYYNQQSKPDFTEPPPPPPRPPNPDEEDEVVIPEGATVYTLFDVLKADGGIDETIFAKFPQAVQDTVNAILPIKNNVSNIDTASFKNRCIKIDKLPNYVPSLMFSDGTWTKGAVEDSYAGSSFPITGVPTNPNSSEVVYYRATGAYPTLLQGLPEDANDKTFGDGSERVLERFMFYRFTGKASIANLNNMLVAVDTYTNLVFAFGYPYAFETILGNSNPSAWANLDYIFYTYDPIGYVADNGALVIEDWYNSALQSKKGAIVPADIKRTGKSPYAQKSIVDAGEIGSSYLQKVMNKVFVDTENANSMYTGSNDGLTITNTLGEQTVIFNFNTATSETVGTFSKASGETVIFEIAADENSATLTDGEIVVNLTVDVSETFLSAIKGKVFKYRGNDGTENIIETYTVSDDGKSIVKAEEGLSPAADVTYTFVSAVTSSEGTFNLNDDTVRFSISENGNTMSFGHGSESKLLVIDSDFIHDFVLHNLKISAKSIKNLGMRSKQKPTGAFFWEDVEEAYITYAIRSALGTDAADVISHKNNGDVVAYFFANTVTIPINGVMEMSDSVNYNLPEYELSKTVTLDSIITTQGKACTIFGEFVETATDNGRKTYNNYGAPHVVLKYDEMQEGFVVDFDKSNLTQTSVTDDFVLKDGETKDIVISYNNESEVTYTLQLTK